MAIQKVKISQIITLLQNKYGEVSSNLNISILELLIFHILSDKENNKNVPKALSLLKSEFVDWNEVRVTQPREIEEILLKHIKTKTYQKSLAINEMLSLVFSVANKMNLDHLAEKDFSEIKKYAHRLKVVHLLPHILLHISQHNNEVTPGFLRVGKRMGLWNDYSSSLKKVTDKSLSTMLNKLNVYFFLHSEDICLVSGYDCHSCILKKDCDLGKKASKKSSKSNAISKVIQEENITSVIEESLPKTKEPTPIDMPEEKTQEVMQKPILVEIKKDVALPIKPTTTKKAANTQKPTKPAITKKAVNTQKPTKPVITKKAVNTQKPTTKTKKVINTKKKDSIAKNITQKPTNEPSKPKNITKKVTKQDNSKKNIKKSSKENSNKKKSVKSK